MSDLTIRQPAHEAAVFRARTVMLMLAIGILGFIGMLVLGAYAPDLRSGSNGGTHAMSNAATGYSALVRLAEATGRHPRIIRSEHDFEDEDLLVVTPDHGSINISQQLDNRLNKPTLMILPKWNVEADPEHRGWVRRRGILDRYDPEGVLSPDWQFSIERRRGAGRQLIPVGDIPPAIRFASPMPVQVIAKVTLEKQKKGQIERPDRKLRPMLVDGRGGIVLAQLGSGPLYVLSDPDLLNNIGMKDPQRAAAALALLDWLNSGGAAGIAFDVTANGFGHSASPLKLAFDPPFLSLTLSIAAVLLLVGLHALGRFGAPERRERAIAFGKAALVDNSAAMIRRAGYEARLGLRYAAVIRDRAVATFGVPARLRDQALDNYLDKMSDDRGGPRFTDLVRAADAATDRTSLVDAAQALHHWQKERLG